MLGKFLLLTEKKLHRNSENLVLMNLHVKVKYSQEVIP